MAQAVVAVSAAPVLSEKQRKTLWSEKEGAGCFSSFKSCKTAGSHHCI